MLKEDGWRAGLGEMVSDKSGEANTLHVPP